MAETFLTKFITVDEARQELIDWYVQTLVTDLKHLRELVEHGNFAQFVPNLRGSSNKVIGDLYAQLELGKKHLQADPQLGMVCVANDSSLAEISFGYHREDLERERLRNRPFADRVKAGIAYLNGKLPADWQQEINLETLDIHSGNACVLGQLWKYIWEQCNRPGAEGCNPYQQTCNYLGIQWQSHGEVTQCGQLGFTWQKPNECEGLTKEWKLQLTGQ
jgi:hypothetical protein